MSIDKFQFICEVVCSNYLFIEGRDGYVTI